MSTTWLVSFERIEAQNRAAADLFRFWAYIDHQNLDFELIQDSKGSLKAPARLATTVATRSQFLDAIGYLMECSFIKSVGRDRWSLHPVLHKWACVYLKEALDPEFVIWSVVSVGSKARKRGSVDYWDAGAHFCAHASHIIDTLNVTNIEIEPGRSNAFLNRLIGLSRLCIAHETNVKKAEEILLLAVEPFRSEALALGPRNPAVDSESSLRALNCLANLYASRGPRVKAVHLYYDLILKLQHPQSTKDSWLHDVCENIIMIGSSDIFREHQLDDGKFTPRTRELLNFMQRINSAGTMLESKQLENAAILYDELRTDMVLTSNDKRSVKVWMASAMCYAQLKQYDKAANLFELVHPVAKTMRGGERNVLTLDILNNYGIVCLKLGLLDKAESLLNAAEQGLRSRRGYSDGLYLNATENLGQLFMKKGDYAKSRSIFGVCLQEATGPLGDRVPRIRMQIEMTEHYQNQSASRTSRVQRSQYHSLTRSSDLGLVV